MEGKKKFRDTKVGGFLSKKLPAVLDIVGDVLPDKGVLGIVKNIVSSDRSMSSEDKAEINQLILDQEVELQRLETEKIKSFHDLERTQLQQEDRFTKRARPFRQYFWLLFLLLCYPLAFCWFGEFLALPDVILAGIFTDFGLYTWKRTEEKKSTFSKITNLL